MTLKRISIVGLAAAALIAVGVGASMRGVHAADSQLPLQTDPGGGAPEKVLLDNNALRVTLISYPLGFHREGRMRRPYDTLIVYLDVADFTAGGGPQASRAPRVDGAPSVSRLGKPAKCDPVDSCGPVDLDGNYVGHPDPVGSLHYHPKGDITPTITVTRPYRVLYLELKR